MIYPKLLAIDGTQRGPRFMIRVNCTDIWLQAKSFGYMAKLAVARYYEPDGWISLAALEVGHNQTRYINRMKQQILGALNGFDWAVYENDRTSRVRLAILLSGLEINFDNLAKNDDSEIRKLTIHEVGKTRNL